MKILGCLCAISYILLAQNVQAAGTTTAPPEELTGKTALACAAMLCLASITRPSECDEAIKEYYSITHRKIKKMIKKRLNFLEMCPAGDGGASAQVVNGAYSSCGAGNYESMECATLGLGKAVIGSCVIVQGNECLQFDEGQEPVVEATFGICVDGEKVVSDGGQLIGEAGCSNFQEAEPIELFPVPGAEQQI